MKRGKNTADAIDNTTTIIRESETDTAMSP
jgi:hypothetical protein